MKNSFLACAMAVSLAMGTGCAGFRSGLEHAVTGAEVSAEDTHKTGYDLGVVAGNLLITAISYGSAYLIHGRKKNEGE